MSFRLPISDSPLTRLALAIHEADLGEDCKAVGDERERHIQAYLKTAADVRNHLAGRWEPQNPPEDVLR